MRMILRYNIQKGSSGLISRRWSYGAVKCWMIGCRCHLCNHEPEWFKPKCKMKKSVLELVCNVGLPEKVNNYTIGEFYNDENNQL